MPLGGRHKVSLGYLGSYYIFSRYNNNSHYDHNVNADAAFNFPGGLSLRVGNTYRAATEERTATTGRQRDYDRVTPYFLGTYKLTESWKIQGLYQFDSLHFLKVIDQTNEYQEQIGGLALFYKFWPKTALLGQYIITGRVYPKSPQGDNISHSPFVGLTWDPTAKLSGTIKFGYTFKNYDQDLPGRKNAPRSWAMSLQNLYRYSRYTQLTLTAQRSIQEDLDFGNNSYENTAFYLTLNHELHYFQAAAYVTCSFSRNQYLNPTQDPVTGDIKKRLDDLVMVGVGVMRPVTRWLRLRADYSYTNRASNFSNFPYNEHRVIAGVQSSF